MPSETRTTIALPGAPWTDGPEWRAYDASLAAIPFDAGLRAIYSGSMALLKQYPVGVLSTHGAWIRITPTAAGFVIIASVDEQGRYILHFGGWHEDALSPSEIITLIDMALAGKLRLIDDCVGGKPFSHTIQIKPLHSDWVTTGEISYFRFFQNWRVRTSTVRSFLPGGTDAGINVAQPPDSVA